MVSATAPLEIQRQRNRDSRLSNVKLSHCCVRRASGCRQEIVAGVRSSQGTKSRIGWTLVARRASASRTKESHRGGAGIACLMGPSGWEE